MSRIKDSIFEELNNHELLEELESQFNQIFKNSNDGGSNIELTNNQKEINEYQRINN